MAPSSLKALDPISRGTIKRFATCLPVIMAIPILIPAPDCWHLLTVSSTLCALVNVVSALANEERPLDVQLNSWDVSFAYIALVYLAAIFV